MIFANLAAYQAYQYETRSYDLAKQIQTEATWTQVICASTVPDIEIVDIYYGEPNIQLYGNPYFGIEGEIPAINANSLICDSDTL